MEELEAMTTLFFFLSGLRIKKGRRRRPGLQCSYLQLKVKKLQQLCLLQCLDQAARLSRAFVYVILRCPCYTAYAGSNSCLQNEKAKRCLPLFYSNFVPEA